MNTPQTDDIARGNHVVPVEWAQQLERERDKAREHLDNMQDQRDFAMKVIKRLEQERDEAREKYATEATEHMLAINKLCNERDEAREDGRRLKAILDLIKKEAQ